MNTSFKSKLLQHFAKKQNKSGGFTLIELLVVIIIIGILAAIALPSFLNQANKAKQSEARTYVGTINRTQQAYRLENPSFSDEIARLGTGVQTQTNTYRYGDNPDYTATNVGQTAPVGGGIDSAVIVYAAPEDAVALKEYGGTTYLVAEAVTGDATATAILCEEDVTGTGSTLGTANLALDVTQPGTVNATGVCGADAKQL